MLVTLDLHIVLRTKDIGSGRAGCMGLAFVLRTMDIGSGRAGYMGLAFVLRAVNIGSGRADYSSFCPYRRSKKAVVLTP